MKLIITQPELEAIVRKHIQDTVQLKDGSAVSIEFTATRGDDGVTATIDIPYMGLAGLQLSSGSVQPAAPQTSKAATKTAEKPKTAGNIFNAAKEAADKAVDGVEPGTTDETSSASEPTSTGETEVLDVAGDDVIVDTNTQPASAGGVTNLFANG